MTAVLRPQPGADGRKERRKEIWSRGDRSETGSSQSKLDVSTLDATFSRACLRTRVSFRSTLLITGGFHVLHVRAVRLGGSATAADHIASREVRAGKWNSQPSGKHCYHRNCYQPSHSKGFELDQSHPSNGTCNAIELKPSADRQNVSRQKYCSDPRNSVYWPDWSR